MTAITRMVWLNPGNKTKDLSADFNVSERVLKESIAILKKNNIIYYQGSKKTGGYFITENFKLIVKPFKPTK